MERKKIHQHGPFLSRIIAGAWRWHEVNSKVVEKLIQESLSEGITSFDHADIYGDHENEGSFGNILKQNGSLRNKIELITKTGIKFKSSKRPSTWIKHYDTSKEHILWSVENSLRMFHTDRIDLLLIHRPDLLLNPEEVANVFEQLKKEGKVLHFGVSNFSVRQFSMLQKYLSFPLVTNQIEISLSKIEPILNGDLDYLLEMGVCPMAWSPLAGGKLLAKGKKIVTDAEKYSATVGQMVLAWLLRHPASIFPIIGTTKPERIKELAKATNINLDRQDWYAMLKSSMGEEMP